MDMGTYHLHASSEFAQARGLRRLHAIGDVQRVHSAHHKYRLELVCLVKL